MEPSRYMTYVLAQSKRNPCLRNLCHFLADDLSRHLCRITSLDFSKLDSSTNENEFGINDLSALLKATASDLPGEIQGRLLIVEDLTKDVIELLGSSLDIDPLFFASHIDGPYMTIESSKPCSAILPSQMKKQNFFTIQWHGTIDFGGNAAGLRRLFSDSNVPRKVMVLPPAQGTHIGLAQHSCSVLKTNLKGNSWLGLVLVDPPPRATYRSFEKEMTLQSQPFQGGYEDFTQRQPFSTRDSLDSDFTRSSLLDDLVYYWTKERPPAFNPQDPDILSPAYYPLKIVAAEWNCYIEVIVHSIKQYEYSTERSQPSAQNEALTTLDADLRALQKWGRRCIQTLNKLNSVTRFINTRNRDQTMREAYDPIVGDYEHIIERVKTYAA